MRGQWRRRKRKEERDEVCCGFSIGKDKESEEQKKKIKIFWIFHPFHLPGEVVLPNIFLPSEARAKKNYFTREVVWPQTEVLLNTPLE